MKAHIESTPRDHLKQLAGEGKIEKPKVHSKSHNKNNNNMESVEMYLEKLQDMVPFMPKHKKLSKAEIISYVIEYIRELRVTLGLTPACEGDDFGDFDMGSLMMMTPLPVEDEERATVTFTVINGSGDDERCPKVDASLYQPTNRQPLGVISSTANNASRKSQEVADKVIYTRDSS